LAMAEVARHDLIHSLELGLGRHRAIITDTANLPAREGSRGLASRRDIWGIQRLGRGCEQRLLKPGFESLGDSFLITLIIIVHGRVCVPVALASPLRTIGVHHMVAEYRLAEWVVSVAGAGVDRDEAARTQPWEMAHALPVRPGLDADLIERRHVEPFLI